MRDADRIASHIRRMTIGERRLRVDDGGECLRDRVQTFFGRDDGADVVAKLPCNQPPVDLPRPGVLAALSFSHLSIETVHAVKPCVDRACFRALAKVVLPLRESPPTKSAPTLLLMLC